MVTEEMNETETAVTDMNGDGGACPPEESAGMTPTEESDTDCAETSFSAENAPLTDMTAEATDDRTDASLAGEDEAYAEEDCAATERRYAELATADYEAICAAFPAARGYSALVDMPGAARFSELRELGLSVEEATRAAMPEMTQYAKSAVRDMRVSSMPQRSESMRGGMSYGEMAAARELFSGLSTKELLSLYRRVNQ